jgi:hypothetical protein
VVSDLTLWFKALFLGQEMRQNLRALSKGAKSNGGFVDKTDWTQVSFLGGQGGSRD